MVKKEEWKSPLLEIKKEGLPTLNQTYPSILSSLKPNTFEDWGDLAAS